MFTLTKIFDDSFDYYGTILNLDMTFDNILRLFEMFEDEAFSNHEKVLIALEMLIYEYSEAIKHLEFSEQLALYKFVLKEFLAIDLDAKSSESETEGSPGKKVMDFAKDAGLIYASFLSEYKIDLFEMQGKLHWEKFSALLTNLGDSTAFKQVVSYRTMKVPSTKEASEDYRNHVIKMKQMYSLEDPEQKAENMENTLDTIASTLKGGG